MCLCRCRRRFRRRVRPPRGWSTPSRQKRPMALPCGRCATIRDAAGCRCSPRWQRPVQTAVPQAAPWLTAPWNRPCSWRWTPRASTAWCWTRGAIPPRWTVHCSTVCCTQATPRRVPAQRRPKPVKKPPAPDTGRQRQSATRKPPSREILSGSRCWASACIRGAAYQKALRRHARCGKLLPKAASPSPF